MNKSKLPKETTKLVKDWFHGVRDFPEDTEFHQECNGSGCENCINGLKMEGKKAKVYEGIGNLRCPHCELIHMTPPNSDIKPGVLNCQKCGQVSIIDSETAERCNSQNRWKVK